jgi:hypothetical protein
MNKSGRIRKIKFLSGDNRQSIKTDLSLQNRRILVDMGKDHKDHEELERLKLWNDHQSV